MQTLDKSKIVIRQADAADIDTISELNIFRERYPGDRRDFFTYTLTNEMTKAVLHLAVVEERVIGVMLTNYDRVYWLYVEPTARRNGIGTLLFGSFLQNGPSAVRVHICEYAGQSLLLKLGYRRGGFQGGSEFKFTKA